MVRSLHTVMPLRLILPPNTYATTMESNMAVANFDQKMGADAPKNQDRATSLLAPFLTIVAPF